MVDDDNYGEIEVERMEDDDNYGEIEGEGW